MYVYSLQLNWPSKYSEKSWSYEVCDFISIKLLTREELIKKVTEQIADEIVRMLPFSKIPREDKDLPFTGFLHCETETYSCCISVLKDDS